MIPDAQDQVRAELAVNFRIDHGRRPRSARDRSGRGDLVKFRGHRGTRSDSSRRLLRPYTREPVELLGLTEPT